MQQKLQRQTLIVDGAEVGIWCTPYTAGKKRVLLFHGIGGDRYGMVPLAAELARDYQVSIVELPGHGVSVEQSIANLAAMQMWYQRVVAACEKHSGAASYIIAHSYSCSFVCTETVSKAAVILLNPVPILSMLSRFYLYVVAYFPALIVPIYNSRLLTTIRTYYLTANSDSLGKQRLDWVGGHAASHAQIAYQIRLVYATMQGASEGREVEKSPDAILITSKDRMVKAGMNTPDMIALHYDTNKIISLPGGHLLPLEGPDVVAAVLRDSALLV